MYENSLMFSETGDHSVKVFNPVTRKCTQHLANGKKTRDGKSAQFVQPAGLIAKRGTVSVVSRLFYGLLKDGKRRSSTENLREFIITFGLHQKKQTPVSFKLDRAISRIQEEYDSVCQCVNEVNANGPDTRSPRYCFYSCLRG